MLTGHIGTIYLPFLVLSSYRRGVINAYLYLGRTGV